MTANARKRSSRGILGGSFDPIHNGHLYMAKQARLAAHLDKIELLPAARPPHKLDRTLTSDTHRLNMIRLAVKSIDWIEIDDRELRRGGISYTVDTVRELAETHAGIDLFFIIGTDSLRELSTWCSIREIVKLVTFVTVPRDEQPFRTTYPALEEKLQGTPLRVLPLTTPPLPISSTEIRQRTVERRSLEGLVPSPVADYIEAHALYRS